MASDILQSNLLRSSVLVTGSHYSMTTLIGRLLAVAPEFHLLHEPANARPTLSYDSLKPANWYEYYGQARGEALAEFLLRAMKSEGFSREVLSKMGKIRSVRHALQVARYIQRKGPMKLAHKPAIIKDPFLLFAARDLQRMAQMRVVLTVRHPCAFTESFVRAGNGFDFANLLQPELFDAMPSEAAAIQGMAQTPKSLVEQAALLWRVLYGFAARYLIGNPLTAAVRQDEIVLETSETTKRLFAFTGGTYNASTDRFIAENFTANAADFSKSGSYIRRDGRSTLNKWHGRLSCEEVVVIQGMTESIAAQLGYGPASWHEPAIET